VGIHVYTWAAVLKELDPSLVRVEALRKSLPPGFARRAELRPAMKYELERLVPGRLAEGDADRLLDSLMRNVSQQRRRAPWRFRTNAVVISAQSPLKTPPRDLYQLTRRVDGLNSTAALTLDFDGNEYSLPAQLETVLDAMCGRGRFRLNELPGGLTREAIVDFAGYLQSIGFLTSD
jgi:hypothetical protein